MKKIALAALLALAIVSAFTGCHPRKGVQGSGVRKTEKRDLASFNAIEVDGTLAVEVSCQKPRSVEIEADDNLLSLVQTDVRDSVLYVKTEGGYDSRQGIILRLTVPNLERVRTSGADTIRISDLKNDKFEIDETGTSTVTAAGETKAVEIRATGASTIDTRSLHAAKATITASGSSAIDVHASEQLDVSVSGADSVTYSGNPKVVNKNMTGAGTVSKKD